MAKRNRSRKGSLAFRPRKRAARIIPRKGAWPSSKETCVLGFVGIKAGMTHILMVDDNKGSASFGMEKLSPATVLEVPDLLVSAIRLYGKDYRGLYTLKDITDITDINGVNGEDVFDVSLLTLTPPFKSKKVQEVIELGVGGNSAKEKLEFAKNLLGKELPFPQVFKEGEYVDVKAVTKGKGWQGAVKRFGVALQRRKSTGRRRHVGNLGPWHPAIVWYYTPQAGQVGFHTRTEYNKRILKISDASKDSISPAGGFVNYGIVNGKYILLQGSIPGPKKRTIRLRKAIRNFSEVKIPEIKSISLDSQQG